jgi:hypothetical protein
MSIYRRIFILIFCFVTFIFCFHGIMDSQTLKFRKAIFLHHSTGSNIYGPNGSKTSVSIEAASYNSKNGYIGSNAISMAESWWPGNDNEWEHWHRIFDEKVSDEIIKTFYNSYQIVIIKSCFPSSSMTAWGTASDTLQPTKKSTFNYKWHFRGIIKVMQNTPNTFFVIWTNAPLVAAGTNNTEAFLSDSFCRWAKDSLEAGKDAVYGKFPPNVYIFDFFHKLAGADGKLPISYAASSSDSHPNSAATELVAPQFVSEVFNAAIKYENNLTANTQLIFGIDSYSLMQNYPNPFNPETKIEYSIPKAGFVTLRIFDVMGKEVETLIHKVQMAGQYSVIWKPNSATGGLTSGIYYYILNSGVFSKTKKILYLK